MEKKRSTTPDIIGECIYGLCDIGERADMRQFLRRQAESYRYIQHLYRKISNASVINELPFVWLWDNFYIIESCFEGIREKFRRHVPLPSCSENPRLFVAAKRYFKLCENVLDGDACSKLLASLSSSCYLGLRELFCARELISAAALTECSEALKEYADIKNPSQNDIEEYGERMGRAIRSLHRICEHDFESDALKGRCAKILSDDPSGAFINMTRETKLMYLQKVMENAEREGMSERKYTRWLLERAQRAKKERERHIGYPLFSYPSHRKILYLGVLFFTSSVSTLLLSFFISPICLFLFFPIFEFVRLCLDRFCSKIVRVQPLPRMEVKGIDKNKAVLVVITSLLTGTRADSRLFESIEKIHLACRDDNVYFGLLCDLPDSHSATSHGDGEIIKNAYGRINALNLKYGKHFVLFERRRSYSKGEEAFMGWERKRGAVTELIRFLKGKHTTFTEKSASCAGELLAGASVKYVITLDSDTNLPIDAVKNMYGAMTHPLAIPYVNKEKGIVTEGYGIMQPRCSTEISNAGATPFTRLMCGAGGTDSYSSAAFDTFQGLFGEGIFCGKGIIDVDAFYEVIDKSCTFPEDSILSHDSLEGAKLRCALIGDLTLTDGFPKNTLSYEKRRHRWIRGDVQNLPFLFSHIRIDSQRVKNGISALSKYKLFLNAANAFLDISLYVCIMVSAFVGEETRTVLLTLSMLHLFLPLLFELIRLPKGALPGYIGRRFFSKGVCVSVISELLRLLYRICSIATDCYFCIDAVSRSLYRMVISKKKLLEWQTAAQSDSSYGGILMFVYKNMFSVISAFLLFVFSGYGALRLISVLWFAFPVISYHMSCDVRKKGKALSNTDKSDLLRYSRDIWKYFEDFVTSDSSFLPPDNIIEAPKRKCAKMTSPTNIGLYLMSTLSARDMGFIDSSQLCKRVRETLTTVERMEKYRGHLFNWYDIKSLALLSPRYISTVDSGNFCACLMVLCEGLAEYASEKTELLELIKRIRAIIDKTDYSFLYNKERNLYRLGSELSEDGTLILSEGCFDLYMSEARTVSYIECAARRAPLKHWASLSRALVTKDGYMGMTSWTGTAFEYFLPTLFLPIYRRSLCREALCFAARQQRERSANFGDARLWGISESCYDERYEDGNYKYKAFGIPTLGLKSGLEKNLVLSPYSSFLMMCIDRHGALENLRSFERAGLYGKYGFYEAADFTPGRYKGGNGAVKSFMSHHLGMSICSCANVLFDGIHVRRFMRYEGMSCGEELLRERIPANAIIKRPRKRTDSIGHREEKCSRRPLSNA